MVIVPILSHMCGQAVYSFGEYSHLNLSRAGIFGTVLEFLYGVCLFYLVQSGFIPPRYSSG